MHRSYKANYPLAYKDLSNHRPEVYYFAVLIYDMPSGYGRDESVNSAVLDLAVLIALKEVKEWIVSAGIIIVNQ